MYDYYMLQNANLPCYISSFVVCIFAEVMTNASFQAAKGNEEMLKCGHKKQVDKHESKTETQVRSLYFYSLPIHTS